MKQGIQGYSVPSSKKESLPVEVLLFDIMLKRDLTEEARKEISETRAKCLKEHKRKTGNRKTKKSKPMATVEEDPAVMMMDSMLSVGNLSEEAKSDVLQARVALHIENALDLSEAPEPESMK